MRDRHSDQLRSKGLSDLNFKELLSMIIDFIYTVTYTQCKHMHTYNLQPLGFSKKKWSWRKGHKCVVVFQKSGPDLKNVRSSLLSGRATDNPDLLAMHEHHASNQPLTGSYQKFELST